jgi:hypothetical protein
VRCGCVVLYTDALVVFLCSVAQVFILCVLFLIWNKDIDFCKDVLVGPPARSSYPAQSKPEPQNTPAALAQEHSFTELFSGSATLASEFHAQGHAVTAVDKKYGRGMDINKPSSFGLLAPFR